MLSVYPLWESRSEAPHPFLLEEAILGACLAGRCGPPAAVAHPPVTATTQKDDHFLLEAGLPFPLSLPSSSPCPLCQCPLWVRCLKSAAPHKRSGAQAVKSRGRQGPDNRRPSLPSLAPFGPTKPGLQGEALQQQGVSYSAPERLRALTHRGSVPETKAFVSPTQPSRYPLTPRPAILAHTAPHLLQPRIPGRLQRGAGRGPRVTMGLQGVNEPLPQRLHISTSHWMKTDMGEGAHEEGAIIPAALSALLKQRARGTG